LEEEIAACTNQSEILSVMHRHEMAQGLVTADAFDPNVKHEVEIGEQNYTKVITINGVDHQVSGATEAQMLAAESALFQSLFEQTAANNTPADSHGRDARGRFVAEERSDEAHQAELIRRSELDLKFKRGELDTATYLAETGAVDAYLASKGISIDALQQVADQKTTADWTQATQEFMNTDEGRIWVGGEANKNKLGEFLIEMGAADAPNAENIRRAAKYLRENNMLVENPETTQRQQIEGAKSQAELDIALGRSSSLWR
jgi:hypothetical protein